jgi:GNAT superfamily N-acetyltransferase
MPELELGSSSIAFLVEVSTKPGQDQSTPQRATLGFRPMLATRPNASGAGDLFPLSCTSAYLPFCEQGIPEIKDLNVLSASRRKGVGTALLDHAESLIAELSDVVGIGVGMDTSYGPAQAMYVNRGYVPDARGLTWNNRHVTWGDTMTVDDALVLYFAQRLKAGS